MSLAQVYYELVSYNCDISFTDNVDEFRTKLAVVLYIQYAVDFTSLYKF